MPTNRTANPYNVVHSFDAWLDSQMEVPVLGFTSSAVGEEMATPCLQVVHHELSDEKVTAGDILRTVGNTEIYGRRVIAEARIVAYVGLAAVDSYVSPTEGMPAADELLKLRNTLFGLFRFRPRIEIRNYMTDTDYADLQGDDQHLVTAMGIDEEAAISDVRDSYVMLEQAFRVRYMYTHEVEIERG